MPQDKKKNAFKTLKERLAKAGKGNMTKKMMEAEKKKKKK